MLTGLAIRLIPGFVTVRGKHGHECRHLCGEISHEAAFEQIERCLRGLVGELLSKSRPLN